MAWRECVVCSESECTEPYCTINGYAYLHCRECGLIYVDNVERTENLYRSYSRGTFKSLRRRLLAPLRRFYHARHFQESMHRARHIFEFACSQIGGGTDGGVCQARAPARRDISEEGQRTFPDIDCNKALLLAAGIERGSNVYGVEIVPKLTVPFKNSYSQFADQVFAGRFEDCRERFARGMIDLITAIDVIEHLEDVVRDLAGIHQFLKPGGALVIQTPDGACAEARGSGSRWGALKPLEHLHLFNADNLATRGRGTGFTEVRRFAPFEMADGNFVAVMRT